MYKLFISISSVGYICADGCITDIRIGGVEWTSMGPEECGQEFMCYMLCWDFEE